MLTETGALTDWALTVSGERRQVTAEELTAMAEAGEADDDTLVLVGETPISLGDLRLLLDIEAELRRIEETYFQEEVELSPEQAENLVSIYEQLLADGGFTLYNTNAADDLTFPSGVDQTVVISAEVSSATMGNDCTVTVKLDKAQPQADVTFSWRAFDGSVTVAGAAEGTGVIKAGATETTFTVQAGQAAGELDDGGQGAFVVQIYDVKTALFDNGRDSWTQAVRVQGQDALKYYEQQSATASKTDRNGIAAAADMNHFGSGGDNPWAVGDATTGEILTGTSNARDQNTFNSWQSSQKAREHHTIAEHTFTVEGLSAGTYTVAFEHGGVAANIPQNAIAYFPDMTWNAGSISPMQQTAQVGYRITWTSPTASTFEYVPGALSVTLNQSTTSKAQQVPLFPNIMISSTISAVLMEMSRSH